MKFIHRDADPKKHFRPGDVLLTRRTIDLYPSYAALDGVAGGNVMTSFGVLGPEEIVLVMTVLWDSVHETVDYLLNTQLGCAWTFTYEDRVRYTYEFMHR